MFKFALEFDAANPKDAAEQLHNWVNGMAQMFGVDAPSQVATVGASVQQPQTTAAAPAEAPAGRKRGPKAATPPAEPSTPAAEPPKTNGAALSKDDIVAELTAIYQGGDQELKDQITEWRNGLGIARLRDLKDAQLPAAAAYIKELAGP
jgi:hypothetical protein